MFGVGTLFGLVLKREQRGTYPKWREQYQPGVGFALCAFCLWNIFKEPQGIYMQASSKEHTRTP